MTTVEHGFNLEAIRAELDTETWEEDPEDDGREIRRVFLGSVFSLTPSGKMYAPFACSNLSPCPTCKGTGRIIPRRYKRRTQKKHIARHAYVLRRFDALFDGPDGMPSLGVQYRPNKRAAYAFIDRQPKKYRMRGFLPGTSCTACNGYGSREAWLDELWQEAAEEAINSIDGVYLSWEDGDAFACESRDKEEEDEDDGNGLEEGDVDTEATEGDVG